MPAQEDQGFMQLASLSRVKTELDDPARSNYYNDRQLFKQILQESDAQLVLRVDSLVRLYLNVSIKADSLKSKMYTTIIALLYLGKYHLFKRLAAETDVRAVLRTESMPFCFTHTIISCFSRDFIAPNIVAYISDGYFDIQSYAPYQWNNDVSALFSSLNTYKQKGELFPFALAIAQGKLTIDFLLTVKQLIENQLRTDSEAARDDRAPAGKFLIPMVWQLIDPSFAGLDECLGSKNISLISWAFAIITASALKKHSANQFAGRYTAVLGELMNCAFSIETPICNQNKFFAFIILTSVANDNFFYGLSFATDVLEKMDIPAVCNFLQNAVFALGAIEDRDFVSTLHKTCLLSAALAARIAESEDPDLDKVRLGQQLDQITSDLQDNCTMKSKVCNINTADFQWFWNKKRSCDATSVAAASDSIVTTDAKRTRFVDL